MGLDIVAFNKIEPVKELKKDGENESSINLDYVRQTFPHVVPDLIKNKYYLIDEAKSFRAGSYSFYSLWRQELSLFAIQQKIKVDKFELLPFEEMINFSDCEGLIGPAISEKLYKDFLIFEKLAEKHNPKKMNQEDWLANYQDFKEAFGAARRKGAVLFC